MEFGSIDVVGWIILLACAFIQGMSKGGVPGLAILAIPFVAMVVPGKASTGLILPMLIVGDLFALLIWRRSVSGRDLVRALPWAIAGVVVGWRLLDFIPDANMNRVIGIIVILILVLQVWRKFSAKSDAPAFSGSTIGRYGYPAVMGMLGGVTTMLANAAGPIISMYLLSMKLSKETFLGTSAWYFFIVNWVKVPFMVEQGMITSESLKVNVMMLPALVAGVAMGVFVAKRLKERTFEALVIVLAAAACLKLLF